MEFRVFKCVVVWGIEKISKERVKLLLQSVGHSPGPGLVINTSCFRVALRSFAPGAYERREQKMVCTKLTGKLKPGCWLGKGLSLWFSFKFYLKMAFKTRKNYLKSKFTCETLVVHCAFLNDSYSFLKCPQKACAFGW